jgi:ADP-ribose pyrophosphatase
VTETSDADATDIEPRVIDEIRDVEDHWQVVERERRFTSRVFAVDSDRVRMGDGSVVPRDYMRHPGAVGVVVFDEDNDRVLTIRQYRHPVGHQLWELPAGLLDQPGENPWAAARRELREEAGYRADDWRVLVDLATTPGCSDEAVRVFLARGAVRDVDPTYVREHEEAGIIAAWVPRVALARLALAGELHNALLVSGVLALTSALSIDGLSALRGPDAPWPMRAFES